MIGLAVATVRHRIASFAGSAVAAFLAVCLLSLSGLLLASALTTGPGADRFGAADAVVATDRSVTLTHTVDKGDGKHKTKSKTKPLTGAATLDDGLTAALEAVPGVDRVVPDAAFPADVTGSAAPAPDAPPTVAHGWASAQLTPYTLGSGHAPGSGEVVVDGSSGARTGDEITLVTKTGEHRLRVSGIATPPGVPSLQNQGAVFVSDDEVRELSGLDGPTALGVLATPGAPGPAWSAALQSAVDAADAPVHDGAPTHPRTTVRTGDARTQADLPLALTNTVGAVSVFGIMLGVTAFAAVFVLVGSVSLVVRGRLRELALLRTVGATPRQLRRLLAGETAVVGVVAGVPGAVCGALLAHPVARVFRDDGVVPAQLVVRILPLVLLGALAAGVGLSVVAARVAAGRATRIAPVEALRETAAQPGGRVVVRVVLTLLGVTGGIVLLVAVPLRSRMGMGMTFVATALLMCGVAAAGPLVVRAVGGVLGRLSGAGSVTGMLAASNVRTSSQRTASVAVPLALMVALDATLLVSSAVLTDVAADQQATRTAAADWYLAPTSGGGAPAQAADDAARLPGVTGTAATLPTTVMVDAHHKPEHYAGVGLTTHGTPVLDLDVTRGALTSSGVAVSGDLAGAQGWEIGDRAGLWLPDATYVDLRVDAVFERSAGFGDVVLPGRLIAQHDPRGLVDGLWVRGDATARGALDDLPGLALADPGSSTARAVNGAATQQAAFEALSAILLAFMAVSVVNSGVIALAARRRELADLHLAGATAGQLRRMLTHESAVTVATGVLVGCAVTAVVVGIFSSAQDGTWRWVANPGGYLAVVGGTVLVGLAAGIVPSFGASRRAVRTGRSAA